MTSCRQIIIDRDPGVTPEFEHHKFPWPAHWIAGGAWDGVRSVVWEFRRRFTLAKAARFRVHVTADQRYDLFLDGARVGWGSERGNHFNWFYESYEIRLDAGRHELSARVWWACEELTHIGHSTARPDFLLHAEADPAAKRNSGVDWAALLDTGVAPWEARERTEYRLVPAQVREGFCCVGARTLADYREPEAKFSVSNASRIAPAAFRAEGDEVLCRWLLTPRTLPAMHEAMVRVGRVRFAAEPATADMRALEDVPVRAADSQAGLVAKWQAFVAEAKPLTIPAHTRQRVLVDLCNYYCAWTGLAFSGGAGAHVALQWSESLFCEPHGFAKGNRDEIEGKYLRGLYDEFVADGARGRFFEPLWWTSGRYLQIVVETADAPLTLRSLSLREIHYPHRFESAFSCSDRRWSGVFRLSKRVLEMCSNETYFDCPYYEQLMYAGDTRLEILTTLATTRDDRLPRKALLMFDRSRSDSGLTMSRCPSRVKQIIPPFSLWWALMVCDYAQWRDDSAFVRARMGGVRAVLDAWREHLQDDGLVLGPLGWNFVDWVPGWRSGMPPSVDAGRRNATLNMHFVMTLRAVAEVEDSLGEHELAARDRALADRVAKACLDLFWDERAGLFAEDETHESFSEHAQCMAVLGGVLDGDSARLRRVAEGLAGNPSLARATVYFRHYLFETYGALGMPQEILRRMGLWHDLVRRGLFTVVEQPEPTRSDCHAWGAHPMYHALATLAGIRPAAPGFRAARFRPQLGDLSSLEASVVHPKGALTLRAAVGNDGLLHGAASTPDGIEGRLVLPDGRTLGWSGGRRTF